MAQEVPLTDRPDCQVVVFDFLLEEPETVTWDGGCVGGWAEGDGTLTWRYAGETAESTYRGPLLQGSMHGQGIWTDASGETYEGEFVDGLRHGRGVLRYADGTRFEGEFVDDHPADGTYFYAGGSSYAGETEAGLPHGYGTYTWADGTRYEGAYENGLPHGYGTYRTWDGNEFSGTWSNGCFRQGDRWATIGATATECGYE